MHVADGILNGGVLATGWTLSAAGLAVGLKKLDYKSIPRTGVATAVLFLASLVAFPTGPFYVHLVMNGMAGVLLGWRIFPAAFVSLLLQALLFQFGGIASLGVNTFNYAFGGMLAYTAFGRLVRSRNRTLCRIGSFAAGALAVAAGALSLSAALYFGGHHPGEYATLAWLALAEHAGVMPIEGIVLVFVIAYVRKVAPEALGIAPLEKGMDT